MMFSKGKGRFSDPKHIRRDRAYLEEAHMAMLEHSIAAEHYQAMAAMYAQRVQRLERDIAEWEAEAVGSPRTEMAADAAASRPRSDQDLTMQRQWPGAASGVVMPMPGSDAPPDPRRAA